jgi:two-component system, NarL family, nitrate/nitrite response regulator NarL
MAKTAHISLFGDNEIAREGLKRLLVEGGFETRCMSIEDIDGILGQLEDEPEHVIVIDTQSGDSGLNACAAVRGKLKTARIVLIGDGCDSATVRQSLGMGASGYLARQVSYEPLILMLELVSMGEKVLPTEFVDDFASNGHIAAVTKWDDVKTRNNLSDREIGILRCLVEGDANKVIARKLGIAEATVKVHVKAILRKLHVLNRTQAAIWVVNQGLFDERALEECEDEA